MNVIRRIKSTARSQHMPQVVSKRVSRIGNQFFDAESIIQLFKLLTTVTTVVALISCGGGGGGGGAVISGDIANDAGTVVSDNNNNIVAVPNNSITTLIKDNLEANYALEVNSIEASILACFRKSGLAGASLVCGVNAKAAAVLAFTNTTLANILALKQNHTLDKSAIVRLLNQYHERDASWLNSATFSPTYTMNSAEVSSLSNSYLSMINAYYSNLILQVNAM